MIEPNFQTAALRDSRIGGDLGTTAVTNELINLIR